MTQGRSACRTGERCEATTLGEAIYCVVHHSEKDAKTLAREIGVRPGYLQDAANPDRDETQFQARSIAPITIAAVNTGIVEFLCREVGGVFVPVPHVEPQHHDILRAHLIAVREFGKHAGHLEAVLDPNSDGGEHITPLEAARFNLEVDETIRHLVQMKLIVSRRSAALR